MDWAGKTRSTLYVGRYEDKKKYIYNMIPGTIPRLRPVETNANKSVHQSTNNHDPYTFDSICLPSSVDFKLSEIEY